MAKPEDIRLIRVNCKDIRPIKAKFDDIRPK